MLQAAIWRSINEFINTSVPIYVALASFTTFALLSTYTGDELTAAKAFSALALLNIIRFPMFLLPSIINSLVECNVSLKRLDEFFKLEELQSGNLVDSEYIGGKMRTIHLFDDQHGDYDTSTRSMRCPSGM